MKALSLPVVTHVLFMLGTLLLASPSKAQIEVINWDTLTHAPAKSLPFDRPFTLRVPLKSNDVQMVNFVERIRYVVFNISIQHTLQQRQKSSPTRSPFQTIKKENWEVIEIDKNPNLLIHFRDSLVLKPSRLYNILIMSDADKQITALFDQFYEFAKAPPISKLFERQKTVRLNDALAAKFRKEVAVNALYYQFSPDAIIPIDNAANPLSLISTYNDKRLDTLYADWESNVNTLKATLNSLTLYNTIGSNAGLKAFAEIPSNPAPGINETYLEKYFMGSSPFLNWIATIRTVNQASYKNIIGGFQDINCDGCKLADERDYPSRKRNIETTLKAAKELLQIAEQMTARNAATFTSAHADLTTFVSDVQQGLAELKAIIASRTKIDKAITDGGHLSMATHWSDSYITSFSTRSKYSIIPDFGVVAPMRVNPSSNPQSPYTFIPYLGFHVNFRYVDKDLPFWSYRKTPWHFLSAFVGWSLVSVAQGPTSKNFSAKDSTQNFFDKSTLLTGLGLRLGNAVRLTGGTVWYFQQSGAATVPEQYQRKLKAWPFLGISLDLELNSVISTFAGILSGSPTRARPIVDVPPIAPVMPVN